MFLAFHSYLVVFFSKSNQNNFGSAVKCYKHQIPNCNYKQNVSDDFKHRYDVDVGSARVLRETTFAQSDFKFQISSFKFQVSSFKIQV